VSLDLLSASGTGPVWGMASADLNATLLVWPPGHELEEHVNADLDVLLLGIEGSATVTVDDDGHELLPGRLLLVEKGSRRAISAGPGGVRYLSVHRRRGPLQIHG
jgi:quercetin dioxygenase-like cupin family protein